VADTEGTETNTHRQEISIEGKKGSGMAGGRDLSALSRRIESGQYGGDQRDITTRMCSKEGGRTTVGVGVLARGKHRIKLPRGALITHPLQVREGGGGIECWSDSRRPGEIREPSGNISKGKTRIDEGSATSLLCGEYREVEGKALVGGVRGRRGGVRGHHSTSAASRSRATEGTAKSPHLKS